MKSNPASAAAVWIALLTVALGTPAPPASAQSKTGTAVGQFLLIEPGARHAAMGNAAVARQDGLQSVYYNPAAIGAIERYGVQLTHSEWLAGITYDYASISLPALRWAGLFVSLTALNSGEMDVRTVEQPHGTGERFDVSNVALGLGAGRRVTDRFFAGAQINYVQETIWNSSLETFTLNLGTLYRVSDDGLHLGASVSNIGTKAGYEGRDLAMQYDNDPSRYGDNSALPGERFTGEFPLPVIFRVGLGKPWQINPRLRLWTEVDAFHPSDNTETVSTGVELTWRDAWALRGGYDNLGRSDGESGLTLGGGVKLDVQTLDVEVDYCWADYGRLEETHRLTLVVMF